MKRERGLRIYPALKDYNKMQEVIENSEFYAEPYLNFFMFKEEPEAFDALETALAELFEPYGIEYKTIRV